MAEKLEKLLDKARRKRMSPQERETQRINFAYGNAPVDDNSTIDTVKAASTIMRSEKGK
jgi:hypothetical protein